MSAGIYPLQRRCVFMSHYTAYNNIHSSVSAFNLPFPWINERNVLDFSIAELHRQFQPEIIFPTKPVFTAQRLYAAARHVIFDLPGKEPLNTRRSTWQRVLAASLCPAQRGSRSDRGWWHYLYTWRKPNSLRLLFLDSTCVFMTTQRCSPLV